MNIKDVIKIKSESDCLCASAQLNEILNDLAKKITIDLEDKNPILLCVMTGGIIPVGHLATRLSFPLQMDYVHATRYQGETSGGKLDWIQKPRLPLKNRTVLIVDDIFDEGITLLEIVKYCKSQGATKIYSAVLVNKVHTRKVDYKPDYVGLDIEDRYLFGFGMDYKNYLRNINAIHAVKGM